METRKRIILSIVSVFLLCCNSQKTMLTENQDLAYNYTDVTSLISSNDFEKIKAFILKHGDKMTFRSFDSNNPHYKFQHCDGFLGADIGQKNRNNDPKTSDFNQLTLVDWNSNIKYYELVIVRQGDLAAKKYWIQKGMQEKQVYLIDVYGKGIDAMKNTLPNYLQQIQQEIEANNNR